MIGFFCNNLPVPNVEIRFQLLKEFHESSTGAHRGQNKVYEKISSEFFWRGMCPDIRTLVRRCDKCNLGKVMRKKSR